MALTSNALAYVQTPNMALVWALTLSFATPRRLCEAGSAIASATRGQFEARILSVSDVNVGYGDWRGGVEAQAISVDIEDGDNSFRDLFDGRAGLALEGSAVTLELASPALAPADWLLCFTGIFERWERVGPGRYRLISRTDDRALQQPLNMQVLTPAAAPNAVDYVRPDAQMITDSSAVSVSPVLGGAIPIVYGTHDSRALIGTVEGTTGAIPCKYLGEYAGPYFRYLVSAGAIFHVERVFKDGVNVATSSWTRETLFTPNGLILTVIRFTATQGTSVITCDGWGLHNGIANPLAGAADPANAPLMRPTEILEHLLVNFVFRAWRGESAWYARSVTPLDGTAWDAAKTFDIRQAHEASLYLDEANASQKAIDIVTEFARANGKRFWWTPAGTLSITSLDRHSSGIYTGDGTGGLIKVDESPDPESGVLRMPPSREQVDLVRRTYWRIAAQSSSRAKASVLRPGSSGRVVDDIDTQWGAGRRFMDRAMLTPASEKMALSAFNVGLSGDAVGAKDGTDVSTWNDTGHAFRTLYGVTQATPANRPILRLGRQNGRASVEFDGSNDILVGTTISNLMTAAEFTYIVVFRLASASQNNGNATVYLNHVILGASDGTFGLYVRTSGGLYYLQAALYDSAQRVVELQIQLDTTYAVQVSHFGGNLTLMFAGGFSWTGITAGNISSMAGTLNLGGNAVGGAAFAGEIMEVLWFGAGDISAQGLTAGFVGGGASFEIGRTLRDDYGIA